MSVWTANDFGNITVNKDYPNSLTRSGNSPTVAELKEKTDKKKIPIALRLKNMFGNLREMSRESLEKVATRTRSSIENVRETIREQGLEMKWSAEYIAAVMGFDRTPTADLVRKANMTRSDFVRMAKSRGQNHDVTKSKDNKER